MLTLFDFQAARRWAGVMGIALAGLAMLPFSGCLPSPLGDPEQSSIDPALEGTWLANGLELAQCSQAGIEYGPGTQKTIYLVKAFDKHCYLVTAVDYYHARDQRIGLFGPGGPSLSWWKAWLVPLGNRRYLVTQPLRYQMPGDADVVRSDGVFYPTFELSMKGNDTCCIDPVIIPEFIERFHAAGSEEARRQLLAQFPPELLRKRIEADPEAATPGDPKPLTLARMGAGLEAQVQRVLEILGIADARVRRALKRMDDPGTAPGH